MLDIKFIRRNTELVKKVLISRNCSLDLGLFLRTDQERRDLLAKIEDLKVSQNKINSQMQALIKDKKDLKKLIGESKSMKNELSELEAKFDLVDEKFSDQAYRIPNTLHASVPIGDISCNKIIKELGSKSKFNFKPKDHVTLAEELDIVDFKRSAKISGSNFILLKGDGAKLERALINFMLDLHTTEHSYREIFPPVLVNRQSMITTAQLPNLEADMYSLDGDGLFLIPTAEVPVTNIHRDEILKEEDLPLSYTAFTPCFRREAGSYGKDTRGLARVHEFNKVELVKFAKPENSYAELESLLKDACKVLELLQLPYRINLLASKDISFAAAKCYDIELYSVATDAWLEVSSCSNFEDFQARRGNIRYKDKKSGKNAYVHTLNGSGVALPRLLIVILENYQQEDGSIIIPEVLKKYFNGRDRIKK